MKKHTKNVTRVSAGQKHPSGPHQPQGRAPQAHANGSNATIAPPATSTPVPSFETPPPTIESRPSAISVGAPGLSSEDTAALGSTVAEHEVEVPAVAFMRSPEVRATVAEPVALRHEDGAESGTVITRAPSPRNGAASGRRPDRGEALARREGHLADDGHWTGDMLKVWFDADAPTGHEHDQEHYAEESARRVRRLWVIVAGAFGVMAVAGAVTLGQIGKRRAAAIDNQPKRSYEERAVSQSLIDPATGKPRVRNDQPAPAAAPSPNQAAPAPIAAEATPAPAQPPPAAEPATGSATAAAGVPTPAAPVAAAPATATATATPTAAPPVPAAINPAAVANPLAAVPNPAAVPALAAAPPAPAVARPPQPAPAVAPAPAPAAARPAALPVAAAPSVAPPAPAPVREAKPAVAAAAPLREEKKADKPEKRVTAVVAAEPPAREPRAEGRKEKAEKPAAVRKTARAEEPSSPAYEKPKAPARPAEASHPSSAPSKLGLDDD